MLETKSSRESFIKVLIGISLEDKTINFHEGKYIKDVIKRLPKKVLEKIIFDADEFSERYYQKIKDDYMNTPGDDEDAKIPRWKISWWLDLKQNFNSLGDEEKSFLLKTAIELIRIDGKTSQTESKLYRILREQIPPAKTVKDKLPDKLDDATYTYLVKELKPERDNSDDTIFENSIFDDIEVEFDDDESKRAIQSHGESKRIDAAIQELQKMSKDSRLLTRYIDAGDLAKNEGEGQYGNLYFLTPQSPGSVEYIIVGDLHGSYTCMKAIIHQSGFFDKVTRFREDSRKNPDIKLIFLGDYVDRGTKGFDGVVRLLAKLIVEYPGHVIPLCGNHEGYYIDKNGEVQSGVHPADTLEFWKKHLPANLIRKYHDFFKCLPVTAFLGNIIFTHGGAPRGGDFKWLGSLNDLNNDARREEMFWSDPHIGADYIEPYMQDIQFEQQRRFNFGRQQFYEFMASTGCRVMFRGHEQFKEGHRCLIKDKGMQLFSVFSVGGRDNVDLPDAAHSYRSVSPKYLSLIRESDKTYTIKPHEVDYHFFNTHEFNGFIAPVKAE